MFGPLCFSNCKQINNSICFENNNIVTECILCNLKFEIVKQQDKLLSHIFNDHQLVIADVSCIANLHSYLNFWKHRLKSTPLQNVCSTLLLDVEKNKQIDKNQKYFLLSDVLPEDRELREGLQKKRLEWALDQQKKEREDINFKRGCLFCRQMLEGTRLKYIDHLSSQHNLNLGRSYNLVFIDKLIDKIEGKMENLQCLYCEKVFKDRNVLKEHMRKKLHKRINPENKDYDCFYIINYLEMGKNTKKESKANENFKGSSDSEDEADWSDWKEEEDECIVCLFCNKTSNNWNELMQHISKSHHFSFEMNTKNLDFYQKVKLVNYIRRQVHRQTCINCDTHCDSNEILLMHMGDDQHFFMPSSHLWDQPEYFFPTYENDTFLSQIEDNEAENDLDITKLGYYL
uniref:C2H2-type domain-containing protein n=1 Tax=Clastoptera arizonana TaxID=38151 RepID=A0A1B6CPI2_9HEMI